VASPHHVEITINGSGGPPVTRGIRWWIDASQVFRDFAKARPWRRSSDTSPATSPYHGIGAIPRHQIPPMPLQAVDSDDFMLSPSAARHSHDLPGDAFITRRPKQVE